MTNMKVLIKDPNQPPRIEEWCDIILGRMNEIVGGWITTAVSNIGPDGGWVGFCDDEGLLKGYPLNFNRPTDHAGIVGSVVFVGVDAEGDECGLTDAQIEDIKAVLFS